jgi:hypothetical protein
MGGRQVYHDNESLCWSWDCKAPYFREGMFTIPDGYAYQEPPHRGLGPALGSYAEDD